MKTVQETIKEYYQNHQEVLCQKYPGLNIRRLTEEFCDFSSLDFHAQYSSEFDTFFSMLEKGTPLEYINHNSHFYRSQFYVDERVLIPRSETEILVEDAINYIKENYYEGYAVAEVGIGSFAIGVSILVDIESPLSFWGGDLSSDAIEVAKRNLENHEKEIEQHKVNISVSDRLEQCESRVDLIVSNPPYIKELEGREGVHDQADSFEPHLALYLPDDEYDKWYEVFFSHAHSSLKDEGALMIEGHEDCLLHLKEIALKYFAKVVLKNDYTNRLRFLYAYK